MEKLKNIKDKDEYQTYKNYIEYEYIKSYYETRLLSLNINELLEILYKKFGNDIILLCHEPIDKFCHRRVLADFIRYKKILNRVINEE